MAVPVLGVESPSEAEPRWMTPRTPSRKTIGPRIARVVELMGFPFMPWQAHWANIAGELVVDEDTGILVPAYPEAMATVMRQQGKTHWLLGAYLDRGLNWKGWDGKPQAIAYSGQTGSLARQKFTKEHWPMIKRSALRAGVSRPRFAAENAGMDFRNGSHMTIWANSADSGHSLTVDMAVMDEIWADTDERREQAANPAMLTRTDRQKLLASTAGTDASTLFLRKQALGRATVDAGKTEGMAYLEFSADATTSDYDPEDPGLWRRIMPSLTGDRATLTVRAVQSWLDELRTEDGDLSEFERAGLNVTQQTGKKSSSPISDILWGDVQDRKLEAPPVGELVFGVESDPEGTIAAVVAVDDGLRCELVEHRRGVSWLTDFLDVAAARTGARVVVDTGGPVAFLADRLEGRGVEVIRFGTQDVKNAAASFMEKLSDAGFRVRPSSVLDAAVDAARKRKIGDGWSWDRYVKGDITALGALTLGLQAQLTTDSAGGPLVYVTN